VNLPPIRAAGIALLVLCSGAPCPAWAVGIPDWVAHAASQPTPSWAAGYHAVALLDSGAYFVSDRGRVSLHECGVRRVLDTQGSNPVLGVVGYERGTSSVRILRGWVIRQRGSRQALGDANVTDAALRDEGTLYADFRHKILRSPDLEPGDVVAWESVVERDPFLAEWDWHFMKDDIPVLRSAFSLSVPPDYEPVAHWRSPDTVAAVRSGQTWTWLQTSLRPALREPLTPASAASEGLLSVTLDGSQAKPGADVGKSFSDWNAVARYLAGLSEGPGTPTPVVVAKAIDLTAGKGSSWNQLVSIARYVQSLNYIAIEMGLGKGGGYTPHAASLVIENGYGDCKDKATLFRSLARAAGFQAFLLSVYSGDPLQVTPDPPSPTQFNHKIVAIRLPDGVDSPMAVQLQGQGRLLAFDPTDPVTPLGDLPEHEQGSLALFEGDPGELFRLPTATSAQRSTRLAFEGTLAPDGNMSGVLRGAMTGQAAVEWEWVRRLHPGSEFNTWILDWLTTGGVQVNATDPAFTLATGGDHASLTAKLDIPSAGRITAGGLLVFRPCLAPAYELPELPDSVRRLSILVPFVSEQDTFAVHLPAGFAPEELPEPVSLRTDFATLDVRWQVVGDRLRVTYAIASRRELLPPERYRDVRTFFSAARAAFQRPVVLVRG
jgi:transglutaminase-like putative cysteine protease